MKGNFKLIMFMTDKYLMLFQEKIHIKILQKVSGAQSLALWLVKNWPKTK